MKTNNNVSAFVRNARLRADLTQKNVSTALGLNSPQILSDIERGGRSLPIKHAKQFCELTNTKTYTLADAYIDDFADRISRELGCI